MDDPLPLVLTESTSRRTTFPTQSLTSPSSKVVCECVRADIWHRLWRLCWRFRQEECTHGCLFLWRAICYSPGGSVPTRIPSHRLSSASILVLCLSSRWTGRAWRLDLRTCSTQQTRSERRKHPPCRRYGNGSWVS